MTDSTLEWRAAVELRVASPGRLVGYAAVYNSASADLGGFTETVGPTAFTRSLASPDGIMALAHHDPKMVLGRAGSGTLKLSSDQRGLAFEISLPDVGYARDLGALVARGDIAGASFAFTVPKGGDAWQFGHGVARRTLNDVDLREISIVSTPAYPSTEVFKRALAAQRQGGPLGLVLARRYIATLGGR